MNSVFDMVIGVWLLMLLVDVYRMCNCCVVFVSLIVVGSGLVCSSVFGVVGMLWFYV